MDGTWDVEAWDARTKSFKAGPGRRAAVTTGCRSNIALPALGRDALDQIRTHANVLNLIDGGSRSLLLMEYVDEFSVYVLGEAALARGLELGDACVGTFWAECLLPNS